MIILDSFTASFATACERHSNNTNPLVQGKNGAVARDCVRSGVLLQQFCGFAGVGGLMKHLISSYQ
jgi:hypothetical protein